MIDSIYFVAVIIEKPAEIISGGKPDCVTACSSLLTSGKHYTFYNSFLEVNGDSGNNKSRCDSGFYHNAGRRGPVSNYFEDLKATMNYISGVTLK